MANPLPLTLDFGTIPQNGQGYTPQQFANLLGTNGRIFTEQAFALFTTGATAPTSDTGPWAANGNTWYYWDSGTGSYVPFLIPQASLKYSVGAVAPDPTVYQFWIETTAGGDPRALKTYFSAAWVDVYANTLAGYSTTAAMNAAIAAGDAATLASANAYTNTQVAANSFPTYPAEATLTAPQTIAIDTNSYKLALTSAPINPAPSPFDTTNRRYIAPADGIYLVTATSQFDNDTGAAATMEVHLDLFKNGSASSPPLGDLDSTPSPNGSRWTPGFAGLVQLAATDYLELFASFDDTVNAGNMTASAITFSVHRISS